MALTREDLNAELERFPTKEFLRAELARYATKEDVGALREEMAQGFGDLRRYMEILVEDLKSTIRLTVEVFSARTEAIERRSSTGRSDHERRIGGLETRVMVLEHSRKRRRS